MAVWSRRDVDVDLRVGFGEVGEEGGAEEGTVVCVSIRMVCAED